MTRTAAPARATAPQLAPPLVDAAWLRDHLGSERLVILDASMGSGPGRSVRIPGALRFDLDGPFSDHEAAGVHTLPAISDFEAAVRALGIDDADHLVVYDDQGVVSSARARWMLRAAGHRRVSVLDGGLPAWEGPTERWPEDAAEAAADTAAASAARDGAVRGPAALVTPDAAARAGDFTATVAEWPDLVDAHELAAMLERADEAVLDARSSGRFLGVEPEPRPGLRPGHMPGARSLPFASLQREGRMLPVAELEPLIAAGLGDASRVAASCGSGVTACVVLLALELTGRFGLLYDGSWSEWGQPGPRPVVIGRDEW